MSAVTNGVLRVFSFLTGEIKFEKYQSTGPCMPAKNPQTTKRPMLAAVALIVAVGLAAYLFSIVAKTSMKMVTDQAGIANEIDAGIKRCEADRIAGQGSGTVEEKKAASARFNQCRMQAIQRANGK